LLAARRCVLSPATPTASDISAVVHNVRHIRFLYHPEDKMCEESPVSMFCSDFTGLMCVWDFEEIKSSSGLELMKKSEFASADEAYNAMMRYEKNGVFASARRNTSLFPTRTVQSTNHWQAHDESILALATLQAAPMIVTTAADCKLRLWAGFPCKMGLRSCQIGSMFGEIDTMDYEECVSARANASEASAKKSQTPSLVRARHPCASAKKS
jgi:hypothetical protein